MENKSVNISGHSFAPVTTDNVKGNIKSAVTIKNSFNEYTEQQKQTLVEAAEEIQALLTQLERSYPPDTTAWKMNIATKAIEHIDREPKLTEKILSALKAGSISALEALLNHPAASFFIGALNDWQQTKFPGK